MWIAVLFFRHQPSLVVYRINKDIAKYRGRGSSSSPACDQEEAALVLCMLTPATENVPGRTQ